MTTTQVEPPVRPGRERGPRRPGWKRWGMPGLLGVLVIGVGSAWWLSQLGAAREGTVSVARQGGEASGGTRTSAEPLRVDVVHPRLGGLTAPDDPAGEPGGF